VKRLFKTSNTVKDRWNASHYTQIKVSVNPDTATAFKEACAVNGVSMASILSEFMDEYNEYNHGPPLQGVV